MKTKTILLGLLVISAFLSLYEINLEAVVLDDNAPPGKTKQAKTSKYAPGEIIIKFKSPDVLEKETVALRLEGRMADAKNIRPAVTDSLKAETHQKDDLTVRGNNINAIHDFPDKVKALVKDNTTLEPVFRGLHNKMRSRKKTENQLNEEKFQKLSNAKKVLKKERKSHNLSNVYILKNIDTSDKSVEEICRELMRDPNVEYAQPNNVMELYDTALPDVTYIPNDHYIQGNTGSWRQSSWSQAYPDMHGVKNTQTIEAHNLFDTDHNGLFDPDETKPGEGVVVAVIDTGADYNHEDLHRNIWVNPGEVRDLNGDGAIDVYDIDTNSDNIISQEEWNGVCDGLDNGYNGQDPNGYIDDVIGYDISGNTLTTDRQNNPIVPDNNPSDYHGHGTHSAGTIAAIGNNAVGVIGIAPYAKIMPVKIFPNSYDDVCAEAIYYAADNGAKALSNSWGPQDRYPSDPTIELAIDDAYDNHDCVVVFAAGNNSDDVAYYSPANYRKTIAVSATDYNDNIAAFSNFGSLITVSAPGVDILSLRAEWTDMYGDGEHLVPNGEASAKYYRSNGTSMACPHVAGYAALIASTTPSLTNEEVREIIKISADDIGDPGFDIYYGYGRMNTYNAIALFKGAVVFDKDIYGTNDTAKITIYDKNGNFDPAVKETTTVYVTSDTESNDVRIDLAETNPNTGIFSGSIRLEEGPPQNDDKLQVHFNDAIYVEYTDSSSNIHTDTGFIKMTMVTVLANGLGVENIIVLARGEDGRVIAGGDTNSTGMARFNIPVGTMVKFQAWHQNSLCGETDYITAPANITINVLPSTVTVLKDDVGVKDVYVYTHTIDGYDLGNSTTDSSGKTTFYIKEGRQVNFEAKNMDGVLIGKTDYVSAPVDVTIQFPRTSTVTVLKDGVAIADAAVSAYDTSGNWCGNIDTDPSGKAVFYLKEQLLVKFQARYQGSLGGETAYVTTPVNVTIDIQELPTIVTVLQAGTGLDNVDVWAYDMNTYECLGTALTDYDGKATFYLIGGLDVFFEAFYGVFMFFSDPVNTPADVTINLPVSIVTVLKDGAPARSMWPKLIDIYAYDIDGAWIGSGTVDYYSGRAPVWLSEGIQAKFVAHDEFDALTDYDGETDYLTTPANVTVNFLSSNITVQKDGRGFEGAEVLAYNTQNHVVCGGYTNSSGMARPWSQEGKPVKFQAIYNYTLVGETAYLNPPANAAINFPRQSVITVLRGGVAMTDLGVGAIDTNGVTVGSAITDSSGRAAFYLKEGMSVNFQAWYQSVLSGETGYVTTPYSGSLNIQTIPSTVTVIQDGAGIANIMVYVYDINNLYVGGALTDAAGKAVFYLKDGLQSRFNIFHNGYLFNSEYIAAPADMTINIPRPCTVTVLKDGMPKGYTEVRAYDINGIQITSGYTNSSGKADICITEGMQVRFGATYNGQSFYSNFITTPGPVTVYVGNEPPKLVIDNTAYSIDESELMEFTVSATDANNNTMNFTHPSPSELPAGAALNVTTNEAGCIEGTFSWTPNYVQAGNYPITFAVIDSTGLSASQTLTITVNNVNRSPALYAGGRTGNEGEAIDFTVTANDEDGDDLNLSCSSLPQNAGFEIMNKWNGYIEGFFMWTPGYDRAGDYTVTFTACDPSGDAAIQTVNITVKDVAVSGTVSDKNGFPLQGARIVVAKYSNDNFTGTMSKQGEATTDSAGHYVINGMLPQGAYTIQVYYSNHMPEYHSQFVIPGQNYEFNFTLREYPLILGIVRNNLDQKRLEGVTVTLKDASTGLMVPGYQRTTDSEGTFRIYPEDNIPNGTYYAICAKSGYSQPTYIPKIVQQGKYNLVTVYMNEVINNPASVSGYIKDISGNPIYRAQVDLVHKTRNLSYRAFTNSSGYYKFGGLPADSQGQYYSLTVFMSYYIGVSETITLHSDENRTASYNLTPSCVVSGIVTDASGNAIYGTKVRLFKEDMTPIKTYSITYPSKSYGFTVDIPLGTYKLKVTASGYREAIQTITFATQGERKTVNFTLVK